MQYVKEIIRLMINIPGGAAVFSIYGIEFLAHPNFSTILLGGGMLGIPISLRSIILVIAPSASDFLLSSLGAWASGAVSMGLMLWVVYFTFCQVVKVESPEGALVKAVVNA